MNIIPATAVNVIYDAIKNDPAYAAAGGSIWVGDAPSDEAGLVREIIETDGLPKMTMGLPVALETQQVSIGVRGAPRSYAVPRNEALRLRYTLASLRNYESRGLRLLTCMPVGGLRHMGKDANEREMFEILFDAVVEPSYAL